MHMQSDLLDNSVRLGNEMEDFMESKPVSAPHSGDNLSNRFSSILDIDSSGSDWRPLTP